ncbi:MULTISPECIES: hypothetical protein [Sorangium]|uniref:hypothetical protein n=1 Tax=Sorangium TaxID=39643 RepID=UPI003D9C0178
MNDKISAVLLLTATRSLRPRGLEDAAALVAEEDQPFLLRDQDVDLSVVIRVEQQRVLDGAGRDRRGVEDSPVQLSHPRMRLQVKLSAIRADEIEAPVAIDVAHSELAQVHPRGIGGIEEARLQVVAAAVARLLARERARASIALAAADRRARRARRPPPARMTGLSAEPTSAAV